MAFRHDLIPLWCFIQPLRNLLRLLIDLIDYSLYLIDFCDNLKKVPGPLAKCCERQTEQQS